MCILFSLGSVTPAIRAIDLLSLSLFVLRVHADHPDDPVAPDQGQRMARLMMAIAAENLAGGFASVAIVAFLTSVVNPRFAAVQYALLASLSMLIGTLGRPWLGAMIETEGYYTVFIVTFWLGMIAVALCIVEWLRQARHPQSIPGPAAAEARKED